MNTLLKDSGLGNKKVYDFVQQDVDELVVSSIKKLTYFITDIAARFDIIKYGAAL